LRKVAAIVCNNGLGHTKRMLSLLKAFYQRYEDSIEVNVFVDVRKIAFFNDTVAYFKKHGYRVKFFDVTSGVYHYEKEFLAKYRKYLQKADHIWCDNLAFPIKYRDDCFFTGSFLWADIIKNKATNKEKELLRKKTPRMIGSKYFATPAVRALTDFTGVGLYAYFPVNFRKKSNPGILLSCGKSRTANGYLNRYITKLLEKIGKNTSGVGIYIEPDYYKKLGVFKNTKKASFNQRMYSSIAAACIRPGFGTINDALSQGGRIFSFFERGNREMSHNAEILENMGVGKSCPNPVAAIAQAKKYLRDTGRQKLHASRLKKLDFKGIDQTICEIKKIVG
jgi:hypothetical protein